MAGIEAHLLPSTSSDIVSFRLSEPAYVAVFSFHRNSARLLYPQRHGQLVRLDAAVHRAFTSQALLPFRSALHYDIASRFSGPGPVTYLLIASEHPLDVASLIHNPDRLHRDMQFRLAGYSEHATISHLTELAVPPSTPDGAWTTDVWYGWSAPAFAHGFSYAAHNAFLYQPLGCGPHGFVVGYWWTGLQCIPTPPRFTPPPPPPNDTLPEDPEKPESEGRSRAADGRSLMHLPPADLGGERRRGALPQSTPDVRAEPSRDRTPVVDAARERAPERVRRAQPQRDVRSEPSPDRTPSGERTREHPAAADRARERSRERQADQPARPEAPRQVEERARSQSAPQQVLRPSPAPSAPASAPRAQTSPPQQVDRPATPDPRR